VPVITLCDTFQSMAALVHTFSSLKAVAPFVEMGAYEALWMRRGASFKTIAEEFRAQPGALPSDLVLPEVAWNTADRAFQRASHNGVADFGVRVHGAGEYPQKLRDAVHPVELLYYRGWWNFVERRSVAVVGTRKPSPKGESRAERLVRMLVADGFMVVSGLARGIDTVALTTAMKLGGPVAAVIGTPICDYYPPENQALQDDIAQNHLLVSQVPILRYHAQRVQQNRMFFPERNITMSALTEATIIVEAGQTSGTLTQARAAIQQGRKLFILDSCFQDPTLTWPALYERKGAIRVREYEDIQRHLALPTNQD
jgi:DNA processing protein